MSEKGAGGSRVCLKFSVTVTHRKTPTYPRKWDTEHYTIKQTSKCGKRRERRKVLLVRQPHGRRVLNPRRFAGSSKLGVTLHYSQTGYGNRGVQPFPAEDCL
uniref:Uncharacterized protein n=1 Tax=Angiostrongylus cantonensis TaxID=6313 RepID=A0A0K0D613_ANGCA